MLLSCHQPHAAGFRQHLVSEQCTRARPGASLQDHCLLPSLVPAATSLGMVTHVTCASRGRRPALVRALSAQLAALAGGAPTQALSVGLQPASHGARSGEPRQGGEQRVRRGAAWQRSLPLRLGTGPVRGGAIPQVMAPALNSSPIHSCRVVAPCRNRAPGCRCASHTAWAPSTGRVLQAGEPTAAGGRETGPDAAGNSAGTGPSPAACTALPELLAALRRMVTWGTAVRGELGYL